jgi:phosphatidylinositol 3-kinase
MKLSREMVEGMGGAASPDYKRFTGHCYSAFLALRRSANLTLNLFSLMTDANIPDIAMEPDKAVLKVKHLD